MTTQKVYGDAAQVPVEAMASAAAYLSREWGENRTLGYAGTHRDGDTALYVFQCKANDGSRWLVASDRWGNTRYFGENRELEREIAFELGVEVN